jgi:hypothetical protein
MTPLKKQTALTFSLFCLGLFPQIGISQNWSNVGLGMPPNGDVNSLAVYNTSLYAGGHFSTAGGNPANFIAEWNGSAWSPLASGIGGTDASTNVFSLAVYNGSLYAGGHFANAGGNPASHIAQWDGSNWTNVGSGLNGDVHCLTVYNGSLYAGGTFTTAGGNPVSNIAQWNGSSWTSLGTGIGLTGNTVLSLAVYNGLLYAGGHFTSAGGAPSNYIAQWNGSKWDSVGSGMNTNGDVYSLTVYNNILYAGGLFTTAGGISASEIAGWNGTTWSSVGKGITGGNVASLMTYNGNLCAGGIFSSAGGIGVSNVAQWNGTSWSGLGTGTDGNINAIAPYNANLFIGGNFLHAGGNSAVNIAQWSGPAGIKENALATVSLFPNPCTGLFELRFQNFSRNSEIEIYNILGEKIYVSTLINIGTTSMVTEIDLSNEPKGVYLYKIVLQRESVLSGKIVVE